MKVEAIIRFGDHQRTFVIPCGTGNKSFKWLGNVSSQRFAMATPNGILRRREQLCSGSDAAQYQARHVKLHNGDIPNPTELLIDRLHDGDVVQVELCDVLAVHQLSSSAQPSNWTTMAYSVSQGHLDNDLGNQTMDDDAEESDVDSNIGSDFGFDNTLKMDSHVNFIKIMLKSQQINTRAVEVAVDRHIPVISRALPRLLSNQIPPVRGALIAQWDLLNDIFTSYTGEDDRMSKENYLCLVEDAGLFPATSSAMKGTLVYQRTCAHCNATPTTFDLDCFLVSLLLAAQLKYNDTLDPAVTVSDCADALERILRDYLLPLAHRLDCLSVLKSAFFSDDCLIKIRYHYDTLQDLFTRIAAKLRDVPTTINAAELTDTLYHAGLSLTHNAGDQEKCRQLLQEVRKGSIYGRNVDILSADFHAADYPLTEFTFSEFIEVIARAAYYQHAKAVGKSDESIGSADANAIVQEMVRGVVAVSDYALGKTVRSASGKHDKRSKQANRK